MTREEKQKAIYVLKKSAPVMPLTQEEFNDYIQTLNKVMDWLEQESRWIPCSEKLPEKGGDYLVTVCCGLLGNEPVREVRKNFFCIYSKKWLYDDDEVIAWMPLPEPYREVEE